MRTDLRAAVAFVALLCAPAVSRADDGYANAPFRDAPIPLAQAAALDRIEAFAKAVAVAGPSVDADDEDDDAAEGADDEEGGPLVDFALFRSTLADQAPGLAEKLGAALDAMGDGGDDAAAAAAKVGPLVDEARQVVLPAEVMGSPAFGAALMASLLLDEGGVAESYEEAVDGEPLAYGAGYFALQRVKSLWATLAPSASADQAANVGEMLAMLDALFLTETPPETLSADPEQAEAPAQQMVGVLEAVANADLYPGRDLAGAATRVHDLAAAGCAAVASGDDAIGLETLTIAAGYYGSTVADTLDVMAPDAATAVAENLEAVEEGEAGDACGPLLDALAAGQKALTP